MDSAAANFAKRLEAIKTSRKRSRDVRCQRYLRIAREEAQGKVIYFNFEKGPWPLSNLSLCNFTFGDWDLTSSEQGYAALKATHFGNPELAEQILATPDPQQCRQLCDSQVPVSFSNSAAWKDDGHAVEAMTMVLRAKFGNRILAEELLRTGEAYLVEDTGCEFWSRGSHRCDDCPRCFSGGSNWMGDLLMQTRTDLRATFDTMALASLAWNETNSSWEDHFLAYRTYCDVKGRDAGLYCLNTATGGPQLPDPVDHSAHPAPSSSPSAIVQLPTSLPPAGSDSPPSDVTFRPDEPVTRPLCEQCGHLAPAPALRKAPSSQRVPLLTIFEEDTGPEVATLKKRTTTIPSLFALPSAPVGPLMPVVELFPCASALRVLPIVAPRFPDGRAPLDVPQRKRPRGVRGGKNQRGVSCSLCRKRHTAGCPLLQGL